MFGAHLARGVNVEGSVTICQQIWGPKETGSSGEFAKKGSDLGRNAEQTIFV